MRGKEKRTASLTTFTTNNLMGETTLTAELIAHYGFVLLQDNPYSITE